MSRRLAGTQVGSRRLFPRHLLHTMTTQAVLIAAAVIPQLSNVQPLVAEQASRPNLVLIMADDMGYECVGANGGTSYRTPAIDELARTGMRFVHGYSQPICTPSRVEIMTGIYNQRNYVRFGVLHPDETTFAQILKRSGYATCIAGKWQLEGGFDAPRRFGFDEYCLWQLTRRPSRYPNPGLEINGKAVDYNGGEYGPDVVSDFLCNFIEKHKDGPFLAYYPMILPHWPFEPTPDGDDWDPEARGVLKGKGKPKYFADMVAYTDKMVGKIVAKLDELKIREQTLVIFVADNGTATNITSRMGDRVVRGGKGSTTDAGTHVPWVVNRPGTIEAGRVSDALVDFSDVFPTLAEVAGAEIPQTLELDGRNFLPVLRGEKESVRDWTYCWYARNGGKNGKEFARTRRFKLYRNGNFYDVSMDPLEKQSLAAAGISAEAVADRKTLQAALDQYENTRRLIRDPYAKKPKR